MRKRSWLQRTLEDEGIDVPGALSATTLAVTLALLMSVAFASC